MELSMMQRAVDKCAKILSDKGYQVHGIEFDVVANREPRGYFSLSENGKSFSEFLNFSRNLKGQPFLALVILVGMRDGVTPQIKSPQW